METTEHRLGIQHLAGCLALSRAAEWNQNEADWRLMLSMGHGWGITLGDGTLAASTLVLPYGGRFAWVSMVLVLPEQRRQGHAARLLRVAVEDLERRRLLPVLDATPAGREVYQHEGFQDRWGFSRLAATSPWPRSPGEGAVRALEAGDWRWMLELDRAAFGASREVLPRTLAARLPAAAFVSGDRRGFVLGRDGREARQLGPLVAEEEPTARALLSRSLGAIEPPVYVDVAARASRLREWLESMGFLFQRPFTRMVHGAEPAPGEERLVYCVAGPELG
jgi:GNAT superfamily N-acetyltransferase